MFRARILLTVAALVTVLHAGCKREVSPDAAQDLEVSGKVTLPEAKSLKRLRIGFIPTGGPAAPSAFPLKDDGSFSGKLRNGTYTYVILPLSDEDRKSVAAVGALPEKYTKPDTGRSIEVRQGGPLELNF